MFQIQEDDLSGEPTRNLLALHLAGMHANSPPGQIFALDLSGLKEPDVTVWTIWDDDQIAAIGALKMLPNGNAEVKSMRTHPDRLRRGAAAQLLEHLIEQAQARGCKQISLETGSGVAFEPALALYRRRGFIKGPRFGDYEASQFNQFWHLEIKERKNLLF